MASPQINNFGATCVAKKVGAVRGIAAGTGDNTEFTAAGVDRLGFGSGKLVFVAHANNTATKKLTLATVKVAYADDNGSGAPGSYGADTTLVSAVDLVTGTGDQYGVYEIDLDFTGKARWVRVKFTPDHDATATDVFEVGSALILGGAMNAKAAQPVTASA